MKIFATAALATTVLAGTKPRFTDDSAAEWIVEHDFSNAGRSRRSGKPPKGLGPGSCEKAKQGQNNIFAFKAKEYGYSQCIFSSLLDLNKRQFERAMWYITENMDSATQSLGHDLVVSADFGFHSIIDDWRRLTAGMPARETQKYLDCGWEPIQPKYLAKIDIVDQPWAMKEGIFRDCGGMCTFVDWSIIDIDSAKFVVKETLNMFLMIIADYFGAIAGIKSDETSGDGLPQCRFNNFYKRANSGAWIPAWVNADGERCKQADKCGQIVRNIFRKTAQFEEFLGESIPSLAEYNDSYKNDLTRLEDEDNFDQGQKIMTKIFE